MGTRGPGPERDPCGIDRGPVRNCPGTRAELSPLSNSYSSSGLLKEMMEPTLPVGAEIWDLDRLRLPVDRVGNLESSRRPPRHRPGDPFIRGPIPYVWIESACRLPGAGLQVSMACRFLCCRFRPGNRWGLDAIAKGLRISGRSTRRGLHSAELAGLLAVEREPGCKLAVSVLNLPDPKAGPKRRPLYGPIPWSWWLPASRLPGKSSQVGAVCWLLAGWNRSAEFELALDDWAEFGLSRFSASRGLDTLERARLISAVRRSGLPPIVSILDATMSTG